MRVLTGDDDNLEVQMAPLIDCVFLLLIFFLVATTLKEEKHILDLALPEADAARVLTSSPPETLVIAVDRFGDIYLGATKANREQLLAELRNEAEKPESERRIVRLDADLETPYQRIIEVIEMATIQGIRDVKLQVRCRDGG